MNLTEISFIRLDSRASPPSRAHLSDAGYDLTTVESFTLAPGRRRAVATGIAIAIPSDHAGLVVARSGLASRHGLSVVNGPGLIDSGYRGEIKVILVNHGDEPVTFDIGDRVAQLVIFPIPDVTMVESDHLPSSDRGESGFGSSGR